MTKQVLKLRQPLFEAAFSASGAYCRVDILTPVLTDAWDIIEVKSTTSVKDVHLHDLAFQAWILAMAGLRIRGGFLCHINPDFVRRGAVDPQRFFIVEDVTNQAANLGQAVANKLDEMFKTIRLPRYPDIVIGPHCDDPHTCPLHDQCWSFVPEQSVLDLYRGTKKGFSLLERGITQLKDIPADFKLTENQQIQRTAAITGKPHVSPRAISAFLDQLKYPLHFLDFETFGTAIPLFDRVRPCQQVPFEFSLHIVPAPGAKPEHRLFLAEGRRDPRPEFMLRLRESIGRQGSIIAFNAEFEKARLRECCEAMPTFTPWLSHIEARFIDLLEPFRSFHYYHPAQAGSASMKAVLPALTGKGYEHLAIQEGGTAKSQVLAGDLRRRSV